MCLFFFFFSDVELYELLISCIYNIWDINHSQIIQFSKFFSHSVGCPSILSMVSFPVQKLLSLIRSYLFIFAYNSFALGKRAKNILVWYMSNSILLMFSPRSFILSSLTLRSSVYLEFIFVCGVMECSNFILLHVAAQFSKHHLLKKLSFLQFLLLLLLS